MYCSPTALPVHAHVILLLLASFYNLVGRDISTTLVDQWLCWAKESSPKDQWLLIARQMNLLGQVWEPWDRRKCHPKFPLGCHLSILLNWALRSLYGGWVALCYQQHLWDGINELVQQSCTWSSTIHPSPYHWMAQSNSFLLCFPIFPFSILSLLRWKLFILALTVVTQLLSLIQLLNLIMAVVLVTMLRVWGWEDCFDLSRNNTRLSKAAPRQFQRVLQHLNLLLNITLSLSHLFSLRYFNRF